MKLNKTLIIAGLIAGSVLVPNVAVRAQNSTNAPAAGARPQAPRGGMNFEYIATRLALTEDQKPKVRPIIEEMTQKVAALNKDTTLEQTERRAKRKELHDQTTAKLKEILTADQLDKWEKMGARQRPANGAKPAKPAAPATGGTSSPQ